MISLLSPHRGKLHLKSIGFLLRILPVLLMAVCFSCATEQAKPEAELAKTQEVYVKLLEKYDFKNAAAFVLSSQRADYLARSQNVRGLKILDQKMTSLQMNMDKKEAEIVTEFEYFLTAKPNVRRLKDVQKWKMVDDEGQNVWRLVSPFPKFE